MAAVHSVPTSSVTHGARSRATGVATVAGALSAPATGAELVSLVGLLPLRPVQWFPPIDGVSLLSRFIIVVRRVGDGWALTIQGMH